MRFRPSYFFIFVLPLSVFHSEIGHSECRDIKGMLGHESEPTETDECRPINLQKTLGPIRNQGNSEWCWAYTTADVLSQAMRSDPRTEGKMLASYVGLVKDDLSAVQVVHEYEKSLGKPSSLANGSSQPEDMWFALQKILESGRL